MRWGWVPAVLAACTIEMNPAFVESTTGEGSGSTMAEDDGATDGPTGAGSQDDDATAGVDATSADDDDGTTTGPGDGPTSADTMDATADDATTGAVECGEEIYSVPGPPLDSDTSVSLGVNQNRRVGEQAQFGSVLVGQQIACWSVWIRANDPVVGELTATIRRASDDTVVANFSETLAGEDITLDWQEHVFTLPKPYTIEPDDLIVVEYYGESRVTFGRSDEAFDGTLTRRALFQNMGYLFGGAADIYGIMSGP